MQGNGRPEEQVGSSSASDSSEALSCDLRTDHLVAAKTASSTSRLLQMVFLAVVVFCVVVPLLETLHPFFGKIVPPVDERRTINQFPSLSLLLRANGDFAEGLNKWFDDRVGFRNLFIRTKNQIDYSIFDTSRKVYVGLDGWLFEHNPGGALERLQADSFNALERSFLDLAGRLREKGVRLVVIGYPDKSRIYPEMAPADEPLLLPDGNYSQLRRFLSRQSALTFIDVEETMRRAKPTTTDFLYFKTDLHATEAGQELIVREIIDRIARAEGRPEIRWRERFEHGTELWGPGGEARFLSPLVPVLENYTSFKGTYKLGGKEPDGQWHVEEVPVPAPINDVDAALYFWEFRSRPDLCADRLPGAVIWGDSFADLYTTLGLHRYFCTLRRLQMYNTSIAPTRIARFLENLPSGTKYFIYEYYTPLMEHTPFLDFPISRAR
jgi:hypothetical protein